MSEHEAHKQHEEEVENIDSTQQETKDNQSQDTESRMTEEDLIQETEAQATESVDSQMEATEKEPDLIEQLQAKNEELEDRTLRLQAEINNIQKRNARERSLAAKYRSQNLASNLLEVLDNLERALATETTSEDAQALKQGVEMVHKQFIAAFNQEKITVVDPLGQEFDPNLHQAISVMPGGDQYPANTVMQVLQKGYQLDDRILRPAMVIVAEETSNAEDK
ncbi:molecular chaperone GrpE [Ignavigranum ruoffiae]|uniref:Protein GrpE n=1 Tax=Ignavigranum ruoffiae TaxID=89093 RepID=A0A1H8Z4T5_9LACT|nr:nucleotide exchange factor GrpE [Ignavigranum ruoffiae]SEP59353.1 molecular chaperone GrpE [Ignavigranum ruoffiae]